MTVMNNGAAMMSLGELNKNISKAAKDLKKVSSGMRLNSAGDDASGYAISEKCEHASTPLCRTTRMCRTAYRF